MGHFDKYKNSPDPVVREKAINWGIAIGLQAVDDLTVSDYLIELAKLNIEGKISDKEVEKRIHEYHKKQPDKKETTTLTRNTKNNPADPTLRVRELNDNFRRDIFNGNLGEFILTAGAAALKNDDRNALINKVQCFEDFDEANDPYQEHDFGAIDFKGEKYFWKIDYYDRNKKFHSSDKADPNLTCRVLTIMQACEY